MLHLCIALVATLATADPFAGLNWRSIGPAVSGGRLGAVAGSDVDPSLYYVGAAGGGVWTSTNGGATFSPVFDDQDVQSIGAIAIDPVDTKTVWVGTGESNPRNEVTQGDGVYKTTDGGKSFKKSLALRNSLVSRIFVDARNTAHVVVAVLGDPFADSHDRGIYVTNDGGATWRQTLYVGPSTGASDLVADVSNPDVLYAGLWEYRRTGWSSNSGGPDDALYRSTDGGATWQRMAGHGLPDETMGRIGLATAQSDPKRLYALIETKHGLLWRSDDGGASWRMVNNDALINERPFYYSKIFVDPINANRVWTENVHMTVSSDGGEHFSITGRGTHGDHHAMWISRDGRRMIEGNDGGVAFSRDHGATWAWNKVLPISQLYHIGYSRENPYRVCIGLQDNGMWCAPSNPLSGRGVSSSQWSSVGGGDGTWALFDPRDPRYIWLAAGGQNFAGELTIRDSKTGENREIGPYMRDQNVIDPKDLSVRLNWETPIAFDPFDSSATYTGGNVLFVTRDRGMTWRRISGDLTRNDQSHEIVTGGLTLDGTGAETSETILAIAPSSRARGEIWVGSDDGVLSLTRDGGAHWKNVTPAGIAPFGRFATISPSPRDAATAYAVYDAHMAGDRGAHVFATHDYGAHWKNIAAGLPADDEARSILVDPRTPNLLYLGLERSLWASWNDGATWQSIASNLPTVSVRDIELQPDSNDLLLATHGRGAWVLDDATPLQQFERAKREGTFVFPVRDAIAWNLSSAFGTRNDGDAPEYGATVSYYLSAPAKANPLLEIVDARGAVVRSFNTHDEDGKQVPDLPNKAGVNRFTWDLTSEDVRPWKAAPDWNQRSFDSGAFVVPGTFTVRMHVDGKTYERPLSVKMDPRMDYTIAQLADHRARQLALIDDLSRVDDALNVLSAVAKNGPERVAKLSGNAVLAKTVQSLIDQAPALISSFTSSPKYDQDNDFLPDVLRERLQAQLDTYFDSLAPATAAQRAEDAALHALTRNRLNAFALFAERVRAVDAELKASSFAPVDE
jgi:photosystem II stability/assembly factor-like uncharacterized protein